MDGASADGPYKCRWTIQTGMTANDKKRRASRVLRQLQRNGQKPEKERYGPVRAHHRDPEPPDHPHNRIRSDLKVRRAQVHGKRIRTGDGTKEGK